MNPQLDRPPIYFLFMASITLGTPLLPKYSRTSFLAFFFLLLAVIFLGISTFIEFLCVMLYAYVFPKLPIVKYYRRKAALEGSKTVSADLAAAGIQNQSDLVTSDSSRIFPSFSRFFIINYCLIFLSILRRLMMIPRTNG